MLAYTNLLCCGWKEISGLTTYRGNFNAALQYLVDRGLIGRGGVPCGAFLFTQAGKRSAYGTRFAKAIVENGLGNVERLPTFTNPNTGHHIQPFMWIVNERALVKYCQDNNMYRNNQYSVF